MSSLKKDEGYKLSLSSSETLALFEQLSGLYELVSKEGIPWGNSTFVRARGSLVSLAQMDEEQLRTFLKANIATGTELVGRLLRWATTADNVPELINVLETLGLDALSKLDTALNLSALRSSFEEWETSQDETDEEYWQRFLAERSFVLEQLFGWPCTIVADKAYVGGKGVDNSGGKVVDFLLKNQLTQNTALVEIKTPQTALITRDYRAGIPNLSGELSGSIVQVLSYKATLTEEHRDLRANSPSQFEVFDPACLVIIGHTEQLSDSSKKRSFELFRRQLSGRVEVLTFDELFGRVARLISVLESAGESTKG